MTLPDSDATIWSDIIEGKRQVQFEFVGAKFFLGSAFRRYKKDPAELPMLTAELHNLLKKNMNLQTVQRDLQKII